VEPQEITKGLLWKIIFRRNSTDSLKSSFYGGPKGTWLWRKKYEMGGKKNKSILLRSLRNILQSPSENQNLYQNVFKIHLFHTKYTKPNIFTDISLETYWYKYQNNLYLENFFIARCTFLNIEPKMCCNITISKDTLKFQSLNAIYIKCIYYIIFKV